jgi:hypothetical protein
VYFNDEGEKVNEKTDNFVKIRKSVTYKQANIFFKIMSDKKYQDLIKKKKDDIETLSAVMPAFIELLVDAIVEWSSDEPINKESVSDLEFPILMELINILMANFTQKKEENDKQVDELKN